MGTKKSSQQESRITKTGAIKELLAAGVESPTEISKKVREKYGLDIAPNYVSTIKNQLKSRKPAKKRASAMGLDAAIEFCEGVGGVEAAKALLGTIERIRKL